MKRILMVMVALATLVGCSKNDDNQAPESQYKNSIIGTWELTHFNGKAVTSLPEVFYKTTTITFGANGSYAGAGVFGNGSGTYTLNGSTAKTYLEGELYTTYEILSLKDGNVEAKMTDSSSSAIIKAKKVK